MAQENKLLWLTNYDEAICKSGNEKSILISFAGSDWCKPCIMLTREVFETSEFRTYSDQNLVLLQADFPRLKKNRLSEQQTKANELLAERFNKEGSFPLVVLIDGEGNIQGMLGYSSGGPTTFISKIKSLISY